MRILSLAIFTSTVLAVAVPQPRQGPATSLDIAIDSPLVKKGQALTQSKREPGKDKIDDDVDDLLDEIDSVLEENAEDFVRGYVQKGGQKPTFTQKSEPASASPSPLARSKREPGKENINEDVDDLLDEIDDVLEENSEEFVRGYVQKGGQEPTFTQKSEPASASPSPLARSKREPGDEDVDDILDEIDDVLEENSEEFVRGYVQKGGKKQ